MKSKEEIKQWLLDNCVDEDGDLDLMGLDFGDFNGDVYLNGMIVKKGLHQYCQKVGGDLDQDNQEVDGDLFQGQQTVEGRIYQGYLGEKKANETLTENSSEDEKIPHNLFTDLAVILLKEGFYFTNFLFTSPSFIESEQICGIDSAKYIIPLLNKGYAYEDINNALVAIYKKYSKEDKNDK